MADTNPSAVVGAVADAYLGSRCLHVIADFRIADIVDDAPRPIAEIADAVGVNAEALTRVLRHLGALGIFSVASGGVAHNDASRLLRSDDPGGLLPLIRLLGLPLLWDAFRDLDVAVATGRPAVANRHPEGFFGYLAAHPEESKVYDDGMVAMTRRRVAAMLPHYDFAPFRVIADIGGGRGHLLQAVLDRTPSATGILFDQPHVLAGVEASPRVTVHPGDFLTDRIPPADCYLMSNIIHDWADAEATAILTAVRAAAPANARLLLFEFVLPEDAGPFAASHIDVFMLALVSGRERTEAEYARLLAASGFDLVRSIPTPGQTILEATPR